MIVVVDKYIRYFIVTTKTTLSTLLIRGINIVFRLLSFLNLRVLFAKTDKYCGVKLKRINLFPEITSNFRTALFQLYYCNFTYQLDYLGCWKNILRSVCIIRTMSSANLKFWQRNTYPGKERHGCDMITSKIQTRFCANVLQ